MIERCAKLLDEFLATATAKKTDGSIASLAVLPAESRADMAGGLAYLAVGAFIHHLQPKLSHALQEHEAEILILARGFIQRFFSGFAGLNSAVDARKEADRLAAAIKSERRAFLVGSLDRIAGTPNFEQLKARYDELRPVWQRAKVLYKQNSDLPNWREMIRKAFPQYTLDDDLLNRISGRLEDLPEELQATVSEKGGEPTPSSIAIEHAARLCGAKPYQLHVSTLFHKLTKAPHRQKVIKSKGITDKL
jgi:hypothetical protein